MPIKIPDDLPAAEVLQRENIFIMTEDRAVHQDIRSLKIIILNLMPTKITTETQILRLLGNSPLQVDISLLHPESHESRHTDQEHLVRFYHTFREIADQTFDGLIITGAPVENLDFTEVDYWPELKEIMEWSKHHVFSTLHICWGAQAGLFYHYGIKKAPLPQKLSGVYHHTLNQRNSKLVRGFDDVFLAPHSRYTESSRGDINRLTDLEILAESEKAGVYLVVNHDRRQVFVTGHPEYDSLTLEEEYLRDKKKGMDIAPPENYYPDDDPEQVPVIRWRSHANLLYVNWLNYYVYQETPYDLGRLDK